jgi:cell division protein FtsQ
MRIKKQTYSAMKFTLMLMVFVVTIGFVGKKQGEALCKKIVITIENQQGNFFINEADINELVTNNGKEMVINLPYETIDLKKIEKRLAAEKYIQSAQVYRDLAGNMMVDVKQERPIARILNNSGADYYISEGGEVLPVSKRFTARVMVLSGSFFNKYIDSNMLADDAGEELFYFIKFVEQDKFWSAQFAQLEVNSKGMIEIFPQVTKQMIEFGSTHAYEKKLSKLKIFYDKILPDRGWNRYNRVNLEFENQIICE